MVCQDKQLFLIYIYINIDLSNAFHSAGMALCKPSEASTFDNNRYCLYALNGLSCKWCSKPNISSMSSSSVNQCASSPFNALRIGWLNFTVPGVLASQSCRTKNQVWNHIGPNLAGILAGNVTYSPPIVSFASSENAVKSTFRVQLTCIFYSHSIVAGGFDVIS